MGKEAITFNQLREVAASNDPTKTNPLLLWSRLLRIKYVSNPPENIPLLFPNTYEKYIKAQEKPKSTNTSIIKAALKSFEKPGTKQKGKEKDDTIHINFHDISDQRKQEEEHSKPNYTIYTTEPKNGEGSTTTISTCSNTNVEEDAKSINIIFTERDLATRDRFVRNIRPTRSNSTLKKTIFDDEEIPVSLASEKEDYINYLGSTENSLSKLKTKTPTLRKTNSWPLLKRDSEEPENKEIEFFSLTNHTIVTLKTPFSRLPTS